MAIKGIPVKVSDNEERIRLKVVDGDTERDIGNASINQLNLPIDISDNGQRRAVETDNGNPYYVGARVYVTQLDNGAVVTAIDRQGITTATITNGGGSGTSDYNALTNKPSIEGVTLTGDKSFPQLNLDILTNTEIESIFNDLF